MIPENPEELTLPQAESQLNPGENPQNRAAYETMMLVDPKTGELPPGIKHLEHEFAKRFKNNEEPLPSIEGAEGTENLDWESIGPNNIGGRTRAIAMDVRDENVMLAAGVSGGVWRTEDGGNTWTKTTAPQQLHSVTVIRQDTRAGREDTWYFGTGELVGNSARGAGAPLRGDGIFKSTDGGRTWVVLPSTATNDPAEFNSPFNYVWDIVLDPKPSTGDVILAAIFGGVVLSEDGGLTWRTVLGDDLLSLGETNLNDEVAIFYSDVHKTSDGTVYASISNTTNDGTTLSEDGGIYQSTTNGLTWRSVVSFNSMPSRRIELGSSIGNPNIIYTVADGLGGPILGKFDATLNRFTNLSGSVPAFGGDFGDYNAQVSYNMMISAHPEDENIVYLGGTNLYRSTDGFNSRNNTTWIGGYSLDNDASVYDNHHPDQHDVIFYPSNPDRMISVNDGGIFRTENNRAETVSYVPLNNGYVTSQYYTAQISKFEEDNFVLGGTQDNGTLLTSNLVSSTSRVLGGDGAYVATTRFGIYYYVSFQNSRMFRVTLGSENQLTSFARIDPIGGGQTNGQPYLFINPYVLDPANQNRMYLAGGDFVWRNRNLSQIPPGSNNKTGFNWDRLLDTNIASGSISAIDASTEPANIVYYGSSNGQVNRIDNANVDSYSVTNLNRNAGVNFPVDANVSSISIDPTNADNVMVTFSNYLVPSIFFSDDGGQTFTDVSGNLEENPDGSGNGPSIRWARVVPIEDDSYQYYVGTSVGLFSTRTLNGSSTIWAQEGANVIGNVVVPMIDYRRSDGRIVAATHGNGLYFSQIPNVDPEPPVSGAEQLEIETSFPNPFSDLVTIRFGIPDSDFVVVRIYDMQGKLVTIASAGLGFTGENEIFWDGTDQIGQRVKDGIYIVRLTYRDQNDATRVILSRQ